MVESFVGGEKDVASAEVSRVIYYFHSQSKANLTKAEQKEMRILLPRLIVGYRNRKRMSR